jgi:hypothetical protein
VSEGYVCRALWRGADGDPDERIRGPDGVRVIRDHLQRAAPGCAYRGDEGVEGIAIGDDVVRALDSARGDRRLALGIGGRRIVRIGQASDERAELELLEEVDHGCLS